ncbi:hypothetical protein ADUPG1_011217 [Aduncisulcus paluster]|nr:hypothetical protein ADUPG1_011217 [Aduncisulcus paluster]
MGKDRSGEDQSNSAKKMMKGEDDYGCFTDISISFYQSSLITGAYICIDFGWEPPSYLIFSFYSLKGEIISKQYTFTEFDQDECYWYFLPIDLSDVVLCEITGKGREKSCFAILSLVFIGKETPEETIIREFGEKKWSEASVVKPKFIKRGDEKSKGRASIPIPRDDPRVINPLFSMAKGKIDSYSKESHWYDNSLEVQEMLKGEYMAYSSHLSIPFPSPSPMKGAYICVDKDYSSPSLLFTFTDCDGKKTFKKYEFTRPSHKYEWYLLPIDLMNVVLCEIEGKGRWDWETCRSFCICSLVFRMSEDIIRAEELSLLPWKQ